jgi:hypothetical protein
MGDAELLAAFLAARLDEDEAGARKAIEASAAPVIYKKHAPTGQWMARPVIYSKDADPPAWEICDGDLTVVAHQTYEGGGLSSKAEADHIAHHDPARVLREVAAGRAILELHRIEVKRAELLPFDPYTGERQPDEYDVTCEVCGWVSQDPTSGCPTLRHLAAVYSGHEGYRPGWKP